MEVSEVSIRCPAILYILFIIANNWWQYVASSLGVGSSGMSLIGIYITEGNRGLHPVVIVKGGNLVIRFDINLIIIRAVWR